MTHTGQSTICKLNPDKLHFIDVDGIRTRYYRAGSGEPLVLIHGGAYGSISSLDRWSGSLAGLTEHFEVVAMDRLGQGYTDNPPRREDYTYEAMFRHLVGFLQRMELGPAHTAGHSQGGLSVAMLAFNHPELVKTAIIVDSGTLAPEDPDPNKANSLFYERMFDSLPKGPETRESLRRHLQALSYMPVSEDVLEETWQIMQLPKTKAAEAWMMEQGGRLGGDRIWRPSLRRKRQEALRLIDERGLSVPTLVVWGNNDESTPVERGLDLYGRICARTPDAEMHIINQSHHAIAQDQPKALTRAIASFCLG